MADSPHSDDIPRRPGARRARILIVDDNDDVRQMMAFMLQSHGHVVAEAAGADEALRHLEEGGFDVVLSDYELPDKTGATMLREAAAAGLLGHATALIVTAHTQTEDTEGFEVVRKPIDVERLLAQVQAVLASSAVPLSPPAAADGGAPAANLVLYVAAGSVASAHARRSLEALLRQDEGCPIAYSLRDLAENTAEAEQDQVVFAPTLVKRGPGPRAWVLGDLADAAVVKDLLKVCGLKPAP